MQDSFGANSGDLGMVFRYGRQQYVGFWDRWDTITGSMFVQSLATPIRPERLLNWTFRSKKCWRSSGGVCSRTGPLVISIGI